MRKLIVGMILTAALFLTSTVKAQTRYTVGVAGAQAFDNSSLGVSVAVEVPFAKHYELDLKDTFSPLESKVALGGGRANIASVGGYIWLSQSWGVTGHVEDSSYNVTKVSKDADYAFGGFAYRGIVGGLPARFTVSYIRQFNNGITPSGVESSHLQGGDIGFTVRFGCIGAVCVRNSEDFVFGRVLTQGNPQCDYPGGPCPRGSALGGGVTASIMLEFPRRIGREYEVF